LAHPDDRDRTYHHGDLRITILDAAERRLESGGIGAVTIRACAPEAGVSPAAPLHHFGSLKGLLSDLAARGFDRLVARLDADPQSEISPTAAAVTSGTYITFAVAPPRMFDLIWRDDLLLPDHAALSVARRSALQRLQSLSRPAMDSARSDRAARILAIRNWSLAHGLAVLLRHGQIISALGDADAGRCSAADFVALACDGTLLDGEKSEV